MLSRVEIEDLLHRKVAFIESLWFWIWVIDWLQFSVTHCLVNRLQIPDQVFGLLLEPINIVEHRVEVLHVSAELPKVRKLVLILASVGSVSSLLPIQPWIHLKSVSLLGLLFSLMVFHGPLPPVHSSLLIFPPNFIELIP